MYTHQEANIRKVRPIDKDRQSSCRAGGHGSATAVFQKHDTKWLSLRKTKLNQSSLLGQLRK